MKTIFTSFALTLALCAAAGATAQTRSAAPAPAADTVMLSETIDGDYIVRRFFVKRQGDNEYTVRYLINLATLNAALDGNQRELNELNSFVENLMRDSLMKVQSVAITGYASPDGPQAFNRTLARNRANNFKNYVDRKYGFSKKFDVKLSSVAEDWNACRPLVAQSQVPDRQTVLNIIDGSLSHDDKEKRLKELPAAVWEYMARNILPPLRRVEVVISYGEGNVVEQRTLIPRPQPAPEPEPVVETRQQCQPCECIVVDEAITGIIFAMPDPDEENMQAVPAQALPTDRGGYGNNRQTAYGGYGNDARYGQRQDSRTDRDYVRAARMEAREADRISREEMRAARKIAKKEAKAAKKAEKAQRRVARDLDRM